MNREIILKFVAYAIVIPYLGAFCLLLALRRGLAKIRGLYIYY